jgi:hypothetical protein
VARRSDESPRGAVTLRYDGHDAVVKPISGGWRVEHEGRLVEDRYLESAIAKAVDIDANEAASIVTGLLDDYLERAAAGLNVTERPCQASSETAQPVFRFLLKLEDGERHNPAVFVTVVPNWAVGETFLADAREQLRILAIDTEVEAEVAAQGINAVFTVEPV